jgi:hypothetical protein
MQKGKEQCSKNTGSLRLFFENGQELCHSLRRKKRSDYKIRLQNLKPNKPSSKTTQQEGSLEPGFRWRGSHRAPHNHPHQVTATPTKNKHDTDVAKKTGHKDELQEDKIRIL